MLALCILLFMYPWVAPTHTFTRYISMRTWPPLWDNRLVKCRLCGGRKGMGVPCLRNNEQNNNAAGLFCVDSVSSFPRWKDSECCWVDSADEPLSDLALDYDEKRLVCRRGSTVCCCDIASQITDRLCTCPGFLLASTQRGKSARTGTQWCLVFRCYWSGSTQQVLFNLSSNMSSRQAGTAAADWAKSGGNSFLLLCAPNLSLSPGCVMRLLGHNWKTLHPSRPRQTLRKLSDVI